MPNKNTLNYECNNSWTYTGESYWLEWLSSTYVSALQVWQINPQIH